MILENFDFSVLDNKDFLEDSVREEIVTPILHELGYKVSGPNRIVRSKSLTHPFVYIGTIQRKINIIPDYILYVNNEPAIIIDAKAPNKNIYSGANVEQAFSYAIHKDIRTGIYSLCNGKKLTIFSISEYEPIAEIDLTKISENWKEVEKYLKPEFVEKPYLADFHPDLGLFMLKLSVKPNTEFVFMDVWLSGIIKMADNEYTIYSASKYGEDDFAISFDFDQLQYENLLKILPKEYKEAILESLSRQPFSLDFKYEHQIEIGVQSKLTNSVSQSTLTNEKFVPFKVNEFFKTD